MTIKFQTLGITRDDARMYLCTYAESGIPLHPEYARELYRIAEWELPKSLRPIELTQEMTDALLDAERYMFGRSQSDT